MQLIIFDFDGVLIDSKQAYIYAYKKTFEYFGYNITYEEIEPKLGGTAEEEFSILVPKSEDETRKEMKRYFDELCISDEFIERFAVFPNSKKVVGELKKRGYFLTLLTNTSKATLEKLLKKFSLSEYWDKVIAAEDDFKSKEDATLFLINHFNTTPQKTFWIDDMVRGIETAKKLSCVAIAIPGWDSKDKLVKAEPDYLVDSLDEVLKILKG